MRFRLIMGTVCLILVGGSVLCSGLEAGQAPAVPQASDGQERLSTPEDQQREHIRAVPQANENCTHYVDNQVSTDGDGSFDTPWDNIAGHVDDLEAGDVLCVRGDTPAAGRAYTETMISLDGGAGTSSGTEEAPIVVRTYPGERVVLKGTGSDILEFIEVSHWQFDGFAFDKESRGGYAVFFRRGSHHNVVRDCEIYDGKGEGVHIVSGDYNVVEDCEIHDFDAGPYKDAHCILIADGRGNVIRNNEIYDCTGDGIQLYDEGQISDTIIENNHIYTTLGPCSENAIDVKIGNPIIRGNVMHGYRYCDGSCGGTGGGIGEAIFLHDQATTVLIEGNEIYDSASGITVNGDQVDVQIVNNVIHDLVTDPQAWTNVGIYVPRRIAADVVNNTLANIPHNALWWVEAQSSDLDIRNNLFYDTGHVVREGSGTGATVDYNGWFNTADRVEGPHDVVGSDPRFVASGDYHLRAISPAVDVGDDTGAPAQDFDGNPRPYGPGVDLGAFEVQQPPSVTDLRVSEGVTTTDSVTVTLVWSAPGRAGQSGVAHHYELRYDDQVVTQGSWDQATVVDANIAAGQPGEAQHITVSLPWSGSGHLYFALRVFDVDSRSSEVSNLAFWPFESAFVPLIAAFCSSL